MVEWLTLIFAPIAHLFAERFEYQSRTVGQVTCIIAMHYLGADFPRGVLSMTKDAEVVNILDGVAT